MFYPGQPRSCFVCNASGHEAKACPRKRPPAKGQLVAVPQVPAPRSGKRPRVSTPDDELSFAEIVRRGSSSCTTPSSTDNPPAESKTPPEELDDDVSDPVDVKDPVAPPATSEVLEVSQPAVETPSDVVSTISPPLPENVPLPIAPDGSDVMELTSEADDQSNLASDPGSQDLLPNDTPYAVS